MGCNINRYSDPINPLQVVGGPCREAVIDAEEDGNTSVVVVYQRLRPGVDRSLKGIPPDGHRRWKKYGNKTIQNANFSRYNIIVSLSCIDYY
jgi:hypothetical protein